MVPVDLTLNETYPATTVVSVEATINMVDFDSMAMEMARESPQKFLSYVTITKHLAFSKIKKETFDRVFESIKTLAECYHLYGMPRAGENYPNKGSKVNGVNYYLKLNSGILRCLFYLQKRGEDKWMDYFKYITLNFYAHYETEGTDLIPRLEGLETDHRDSILFGGCFYGFVKGLKRREPKKFASFILTINMSKMGLPRPNEELVKEKEYATANFLTSTPRPLPDEEYVTHRDYKGKLTNTMLNKELICKELRRTVREVFKGKVYTKIDHYKPFCPSTNANYNNGRAMMGSVGTVIDVIREEGLDIDPSGKLIELIEELVIADNRPTIESSHFYGNDDSILHNALPIRQYAELRGLSYDASELELKWIKVMDSLEERARSEKPNVIPVGLAEALKVRVISKGPPILYTYLKPFQKFMHRTLKHIPVFQLIGKPVTEEIINNLFTEADTDPSIQIVNGDYKASTDNLRGWVSETLANELCAVLKENAVGNDDSFEIDEALLIKSLTGHMFQFFDKKGKWIKELPQLDGQLMGSISSFPFLCLANAALCRLALEWADGKKYTIYNLPLLVNGDDCTMKGLRQDVIIPEISIRFLWTKITNFAGLTSSQGKTLFSLIHKPIVVINSMTFDWCPKTKRFIQRRFIPLGIMLNKPRSGLNGASQDRSYGQLGSLHRELNKMTPDFCWEKVSETFINNVKPILKRCPNIPWITPEYLGGPGLLPKGEVPKHELKLFTYMIMHLDRTDLGGRNKPQKFRTLPEWQFHNIVEESYKEAEVKKTTLLYTGAEGDEINMEDESSRLYLLQVVETLFRRDNVQNPQMKKERARESDLYQRRSKEDDEEAAKALTRTEKQNMRFHDFMAKRLAALKDSTFIKVRSWDEIVYQSIKECYPIIGKTRPKVNEVVDLIEDDLKGGEEVEEYYHGPGWEFNKWLITDFSVGTKNVLRDVSLDESKYDWQEVETIQHISNSKISFETLDIALSELDAEELRIIRDTLQHDYAFDVFVWDTQALIPLF